MGEQCEILSRLKSIERLIQAEGTPFHKMIACPACPQLADSILFQGGEQPGRTPGWVIEHFMIGSLTAFPLRTHAESGLLLEGLLKQTFFLAKQVRRYFVE